MTSAEHVAFYPLLGCNARCPFCSTRVYTSEGIVATSDFLAGRRSRGLGEHTFGLEEAKARFDKLHEEGVTRVTLQGGEPTIWPWLLELIAYGKTIGLPEQIVVTNGIRLADPAYAAALSRSGANTVALSVFGATAAKHDESLGVDGAFEALATGAENLAALGPGGASVTAQLILHAKNHRELCAMLSFWYSRGIRHFGVRLLREVPNVTGDEGDVWFFDLEALRPELERALELSMRLPGATVVFSELPYCLVEPRNIGFVLADLAAGRRISGSMRTENRIDPSAAPKRMDGPERRLPLHTVACADCDLASVCTKLEPPWALRFSGELRAIRVAAQVSALLAGARAGQRSDSLARLLEVEDADLEAFGVDPALVAPHRGVIAEPYRRAFASLARERLEAGAVVRFLSFAALGARTRLDKAPKEVLAELFRMATPSGRAQLRFVSQRAACIQATPLWMVFAGKMELPGGAVDAPFWAIVHDERSAPESELECLLPARSSEA